MIAWFLQLTTYLDTSNKIYVSSFSLAEYDVLVYPFLSLFSKIHTTKETTVIISKWKLHKLK